MIDIVIELADVIAGLRTELEAARRRGTENDLRFELGTVELEVSVAVQKEAGGRAAVKFWVVELAGDGKVSSTSTQRVKLTLNPRLTITSSSEEPVMADRSPFISGDEDVGER